MFSVGFADPSATDLWPWQRNTSSLRQTLSPEVEDVLMKTVAESPAVSNRSKRRVREFRTQTAPIPSTTLESFPNALQGSIAAYLGAEDIGNLAGSGAVGSRRTFLARPEIIWQLTDTCWDDDIPEAVTRARKEEQYIKNCRRKLADDLTNYVFDARYPADRDQYALSPSSLLVQQGEKEVLAATFATDPDFTEREEFNESHDAPYKIPNDWEGAHQAIETALTAGDNIALAWEPIGRYAIGRKLPLDDRLESDITYIESRWPFGIPADAKDENQRRRFVLERQLPRYLLKDTSEEQRQAALEELQTYEQYTEDEEFPPKSFPLASPDPRVF